MANKTPLEQDQHAIMVNNFTKYLEKNKITFRVEFIIPSEKIQPDKADVVSVNHNDIFMFEIKSGNEIYVEDIQQVKRHMHLMKKAYPLYDISELFIFKITMKEKYLEFKNLFVGLEVLFFDEKENTIQNANGRNLEEILKLKVGKYAVLKTVFRRLMLPHQ